MSDGYKELHNKDLILFKPKGEVIRFGCCDCGLVHKFAVALEENGMIGMIIERDDRATAQRRRFNKFIKE